MLRAWLTACEPSLPDPQTAQFACKSGTSVIHACCLRLRACELGQCGMERDLSKCYDNVPHAVAATSLQVAAVPRRVSAVAQAAWKGPRVCQVAGEPAREPLWPKRGLPQRDSTAPKALCSVLAPWETQGKKFLFMDDRSVVADSTQQLEEDIAATDAFDIGTGAIENVSKRQRWERGGHTRIEHLGIVATPDDAEVDIKPAAGWAKLDKCVQKIRSLPGPSHTRMRAVAAYAKPLWTWCCPIFALPPREMAKKVCGSADSVLLVVCWTFLGKSYRPPPCVQYRHDGCGAHYKLGLGVERLFGAQLQAFC